MMPFAPLLGFSPGSETVAVPDSETAAVRFENTATNLSQSTTFQLRHPACPGAERA
jgi:hypothetical protein